MMFDPNWAEATEPLVKLYQKKRHPLEYKNLFQLLIMVVLSARDSDKHINQIAPKLFERYPDMKALSLANQEELTQQLSGIVNFGNKA